MRRPIDTSSPRARAVLDRVRSDRAPGASDHLRRPQPRGPALRGRGALAAHHDPEVPWQRVVRADGSLARGEAQRKLLEEEGVPFEGERVDMQAAWMPPS